MCSTAPEVFGPTQGFAEGIDIPVTLPVVASLEESCPTGGPVFEKVFFEDAAFQAAEAILEEMAFVQEACLKGCRFLARDSVQKKGNRELSSCLNEGGCDNQISHGLKGSQDCRLASCIGAKDDGSAQKTRHRGDASFEGIAFEKGGIVACRDETQGLFIAQAAIVFDTEFDQHGAPPVPFL